MPIYEFKCARCQSRCCLLCKMGSTGVDEQCPTCGEKQLVRVMSGFASPGIGGQGGCSSCSGTNCASCSSKH